MFLTCSVYNSHHFCFNSKILLLWATKWFNTEWFVLKGVSILMKKKSSSAVESLNSFPGCVFNLHSYHFYSVLSLEFHMKEEIICMLFWIRHLNAIFTDVVIVQSLSPVWPFAIPLTAACLASLSFTISQSLLKLMSITSVMPSKHITLCHPLLFLSSIFPRIRLFSNESVLCIRWPSIGASTSVSPINIQD